MHGTGIKIKYSLIILSDQQLC